jgi:hypothetical protein
MITKMLPRQRIPPNIEAAILAKSARRCTLCLHLKGDVVKVGLEAWLEIKDGKNTSTCSNAWHADLARLCTASFQG